MATKQGKISFGATKSSRKKTNDSSQLTSLSSFETARPRRGGIPFGAIYLQRQQQLQNNGRLMATATSGIGTPQSNKMAIDPSPRSTAPSPEQLPSQLHARTGVGRAITSRRQRKVLRENIQGITKPDIRRLARRGGVKRIKRTVYNEIRCTITARLKHILQKVVAITGYQKRKTVTILDVVYALKALGDPIAGFGDVNKISL